MNKTTETWITKTYSSIFYFFDVTPGYTFTPTTSITDAVFYSSPIYSFLKKFLNSGVRLFLNVFTILETNNLCVNRSSLSSSNQTITCETNTVNASNDAGVSLISNDVTDSDRFRMIPIYGVAKEEFGFSYVVGYIIVVFVSMNALSC